MRLARAGALAMVAGLLGLGLLSSAVPARAEGVPVVPQAWLDFLATHPELGVRGAGVGVATGAAAGALEAGAFYLGYWGSTRALHWAFGATGDDRSHAGIEAGYSWLLSGTTFADPNSVSRTSRLRVNEQGGGFGVWNDTGHAVTMSAEGLCRVQPTGVVFQCGTPDTRPDAPLSVPAGQQMRIWNFRAEVGPHNECYVKTCELASAVFIAGDGQDAHVVGEWSYSPAGAPWTVHVNVICEPVGGGPAVAVQGADLTVVPNSGVMPTLTVPSCLGQATAIGATLSGGRATDPGAVLAAIPLTRTAPDPGTATDPTPRDVGTGTPVTGDNPVEDPTITGSVVPHGANCWGSAWSWNPINWVYIPVKCALIWAFVPDDLPQLWTDFAGDIGGSAPWSYILAGPAAVKNLVIGWGNPGSSCGTSTGNGSGPLAALPLSNVQPWCALSSGDGAGLFTVGTMRGVATAGIWIVFLWACYHRAKRLIGDSGPNDPGSGDPGGNSGGSDAAGYSPERDIDAYNGRDSF